MNDMKAILTACAAVLAAVVLIGNALADPIVQAGFTVNPSVISPGSDGYVQMTLSSTGSTDASNVRVAITSVDSGVAIDSYSGVYIGGIAKGSSIQESFKFSVLKNTPPGMYRMSFQTDYCQSSSCSSTYQFAVINVQSKPLLSLDSVTPYQINIGGATNLTFTISNNGNSDLTNVIFTWTVPSNQILPLSRSNRIVLPYIAAGSKTDIPMEVSANPTITPGMYPVSVTMNYLDKAGTEQNSTSVIGLIVGGATDFSVTMQEFANNMLTLSIANIGVSTATSTLITVPDRNGIPLTGARSVYLGNLNTGDSTTASFTLSMNSSSAEQSIVQHSLQSNGTQFNRSMTQADRTAANDIRPLLVDISYTDSSGTRQTIEKTVSIVSSPSTQLLQSYRNSSNGAANANTIYIVVAAIAVAATAFYILRRRRKNKR